MAVSLDLSSSAALQHVPIRVAKMAQDQQRVDGEAAVKLIDQAEVGPDGVGAHVDTHA